MGEDQTSPTDRTTTEPGRPRRAAMPQDSAGIGCGDPRSYPDFRPPFYPAVNGKTAPSVDTAGRNDRITLEFLAVYYELNCRYAALVEARKDPERRSHEERE